jgi:hypothetical protein
MLPIGEAFLAPRILLGKKGSVVTVRMVAMRVECTQLYPIGPLSGGHKTGPLDFSAYDSKR